MGPQGRVDLSGPDRRERIDSHRVSRAELAGWMDGLVVPGLAPPTRMEALRVNRPETAERTGRFEVSTPAPPGISGPGSGEAMDRLGSIARLPGGVRATCEGVARLWEAAGRPGRLHVLDVSAAGCEAGPALLRWADRAGVRIAITRLGQDPAGCEHAVLGLAGDPRVQVVPGDMQQLKPASADIVTAVLVLHHLPPVHVAWTLLHWRQAARIGVVAVDLRHSQAARAGIATLGRHIAARAHIPTLGSHTAALARIAALGRHMAALARIPLLGRHLSPSGRPGRDAPLAVRWGFREEDLADLRSYPGLEGLQYRRRPWFWWQVTLGGDPPPCGM